MVFTERPASKEYVAANGHDMLQDPIPSRFDGSWFFTSGYAYCADNCRACAGGDNMEDYAGEREYED